MIKKEDIIAAYNYRFATKKFTNQKISADDFNFIMETARLSPSSFGLEPWKFLVIKDINVKQVIGAFSPGAKNQLFSASHFVVILARKESSINVESKYFDKISAVHKYPENVKEGMKMAFNSFMINDHDLTDNRKIFDWASKQCYIALANMMSSAAMIGIDSCAMEGFNRENLENALSAANLIDLKQFGVAAMVAFGYRDPSGEMFEKTRQNIDDIVEYI